MNRSLLLLFAAALLVPAAHAQHPLDVPFPAFDGTRPLAPTEAPLGGGTPDTTDWRAYFPLEVGNRWQYRVDYFDPPANYYYGYEVVRDTLIEGRRYVAVRRCTEHLGEVFCSDRYTPPVFEEIRYDTTHALVVEWVVRTNGYASDEWWEPVPCALDAPFDSVTECTFPGTGQMYYFVSGGSGYNLVLPPDTVRGVVYKHFDGLPFVMGAVAGFGVVSREYTEGNYSYEALVYARVGGEEYGTPAFVFPTAVESAPGTEPEVSLSVWPNPARGRAWVAFVPEEGGAMRLEVHDALGRLVHRQEVMAVPGVRKEVALDFAGLAVGPYVVRLQTSSQTVARVVTLAG